jgi:hypothetical protein
VLDESKSLRDLQRASVRRDLQLMALVLHKDCNNAEARFRPRPQGPTEQPYLRVGSLCKVTNITAGSHLDIRPLCKPEILIHQAQVP